MAQEIKILDMREFPSTDPERVGKFDMIITYQVDPYRVYLITIKKEEFSEDKIKEAIKKDLAERQKWVGKTIQL